MRPARLEMEGFGAFRDPVAVDFTGADLFALTGPTGSGKTTVIDGICFALFGCVPRYDDRRLVAPAISQGRAEARLRLDFTVEGTAYTVVRVVRRTPKGATTKEARLEESTTGEVLAGNEKEVTAVAERILGLTFDHFTTCVVLPQGEFARFLHEKPEQRQDLLVKLLDLGVYERMATIARRRASDADADAGHLARRIDDLAGATPQAKAEADARVAMLRELRAEIDSRLPALAALTEKADAARARASEATAWRGLLDDAVVPEGIAALGDRLVAAQQDAAAALTAAQAAEVDVDQAEARLAGLPPRAGLERARDQHAERAELAARAEKGEAIVRQAVADEEAAGDALAELETAARAAASELERLRAEHRAHAVVADLVVGEPCPVCQHVVEVLPQTTPPVDLVTATSAHEVAAAAVEDARRRLRQASTHRTKCETKMEEVQARLAASGDLPAIADIDAALTGVTDAEHKLVTARSLAKQARAAHDTAAGVLADLQRHETEQRTAFDRVRDALAPLGPPARSADGLAVDWQALAVWAVEAKVEQESAAAAATEQAAAFDAERSAALRLLAERCAEAGVEIGTQPPRDAVVELLVRAEGNAATLADQLREVGKLRAELADLTTTRDLHSTIARLLGSTGFEKWLLDEALDLLAAGASELLLDLSSGQYSLGLDEKRSGFVVIDHRNADETRLARTLSGGETFLASLALALALADQLSMLAAHGGARLDAIFLDEGFGTLDPATLDTVAAAIEELGSRGRMVGLISHVPELADRVPVRFEVAKGPHTATVERIDR